MSTSSHPSLAVDSLSVEEVSPFQKKEGLTIIVSDLMERGSSQVYGVICNVPNGDYDSPKKGSDAWLLPE